MSDELNASLPFRLRVRGHDGSRAGYNRDSARSATSFEQASRIGLGLAAMAIGDLVAFRESCRSPSAVKIEFHRLNSMVLDRRSSRLLAG